MVLNMDVIQALLQESDKFMLLLARLAGIAFSPIYSTRNLPAMWKASFALFISLLAWQFGIGDLYQVPSSMGVYAVVLISELIAGLVIAMAAQLFFAAIQLAGEVLDTQMGFGIMNVLDPLSGTQAPLLGNFKYILAILVFLQVNGHHYLLQALFDSYQYVPIGQVSLNEGIMSYLISLFGNVFVIAMKLAFPIMGTLLFTDIILGVMSRTVPQMNIFMVGMPVKVLIGFGVLLVIIPLYIYLFNILTADMIKQVYQIISLLVKA